MEDQDDRDARAEKWQRFSEKKIFIHFYDKEDLKTSSDNVLQEGIQNVKKLKEAPIKHKKKFEKLSLRKIIKQSPRTLDQLKLCLKRPGSVDDSD